MLNVKPVILEGHHVQLEPLKESHKNELYEAAQDEAIWAVTSSKAYGDQFYRWFDKALKGMQQQEQLPFAVRRKSDQRLIGSTRYYEINPEHHRLAIGYTWYIPEVWGSAVNPECKLLLLNLAFEEMHVNRVEFFTDSRHLHSRAAIKKLGAIEEAVLRYHMILKGGHIRDSVLFSIVRPDWIHVKSKLEGRLEDFKSDKIKAAVLT